MDSVGKRRQGSASLLLMIKHDHKVTRIYAALIMSVLFKVWIIKTYPEKNKHTKLAGKQANVITNVGFPCR